MSTVREPLTERQKQVFDLIVASIEENGSPPTVRELSAAMGMDSPHGSHCHLKYLAKKGYIENIGTFKSRGIRIKGVRWQMVLLENGDA